MARAYCAYSRCRLGLFWVFFSQLSSLFFFLFETMKICSRQGQFELMSVNHSARLRGIIVIYFQLSLTRRYIVCSH